jgi:hypothetical protein
MQLEGDFILKEGSIENHNPQPGEKPVYRGFRHRDGKLEKVTEYVVVTRRPCLSAGCAATLLASNHGRAIEAAGRFITDEAKVRILLDRLRNGNRSGNKKNSFQVLLQVEMIDYYEEVVKTEIITHRIIEPRPEIETNP